MPFTNALLLGAASAQGSFVTFSGMTGQNGFSTPVLDSTITITSDPMNLFDSAVNSGSVMSLAPLRQAGRYLFILRQNYTSVSGYVKTDPDNRGYVDLAIMSIGSAQQAAGNQAGTFVDSPINLYIQNTDTFETVGFNVADDTGTAGSHGLGLTMRMNSVADVGTVSGTAIVEIRKIG